MGAVPVSQRQVVETLGLDRRQGDRVVSEITETKIAD